MHTLILSIIPITSLIVIFACGPYIHSKKCGDSPRRGILVCKHDLERVELHIKMNATVQKGKCVGYLRTNAATLTKTQHMGRMAYLWGDPGASSPGISTNHTSLILSSWLTFTFFSKAIIIFVIVN